MPPLMMIVLAHSTMNSASASIRSRVRSTSGRNTAKTIAFHTQAHLVAALIGKSAVAVV